MSKNDFATAARIGRTPADRWTLLSNARRRNALRKAILAAATDEHRALVARFFPGDRIESPAAWDLLFDIAARVAA